MAMLKVKVSFIAFPNLTATFSFEVLNHVKQKILSGNLEHILLPGFVLYTYE